MAFLGTVTSGSYVPPTGITTVLREQLYDVVTNIDPYATQVLDMFPSQAIESPLYQWPIDNLPALVQNTTSGSVDVAGINTQGISEGFTPAYTSYPYAAQPQRVTNYIQMFAALVKVSDTLKRAKPTGIRDPYNWEVIKATRVIKKAIETRLFDNPSANANWTVGNSGDPRRMHTLWSWTTNAAGYAAPDTVNLLGNTTANGTLTPAAVDAGIEQAVTLGGAPNVCAMSLGVKFDLSAQLRSSNAQFSGTSGNQPLNFQTITAQERKIIRNVDIYEGDAGELMLVWTRQIPQSSTTGGGGKAWILQTDMIQTGFYSPVEHIPLAKTGHNTQGIIVGEFGYKILSPKAHWAINNVTT